MVKTGRFWSGFWILRSKRNKVQFKHSHKSDQRYRADLPSYQYLNVHILAISGLYLYNIQYRPALWVLSTQSHKKHTYFWWESIHFSIYIMWMPVSARGQLSRGTTILWKKIWSFNKIQVYGGPPSQIGLISNKRTQCWNFPVGRS